MFTFVLEVIQLLFSTTALPNSLLETMIEALNIKTCTFCLNWKGGCLTVVGMKILKYFVLPEADDNPGNVRAVDVLFPGVDARVVYTILLRVDISPGEVLLPRVDARVIDILLLRLGISRVDVL